MSENSRRLQLRSLDVSACFAAIGKAPPRLALFQSLPAAAARPSPFLLTEKGEPLPLVRAVFEVLAETRILLRMSNLSAESDLTIETLFLAAHADGPWIMLSRRSAASGSLWDLALLGRRDALLSTFELLFALAQIELPAEPFMLDLDWPAVVTIAAMADIANREEAMAVLERRPLDLELLSGPLPLEAVRDVVRVEQESPAIRSAVTRINLLTGGALGQAEPRAIAKEGLVCLRKSGLVDGDDRPTAALMALVAILRRGSSLTGLTRLERGSAATEGDALMLLRTEAHAFLGLWRLEIGGRVNGLRLLATDGQDLLKALDNFVEGHGPHAPAEEANQFCGQCGARHEAGQRFCRACGASLA